jgi:hypothetical protein
MATATTSTMLAKGVSGNRDIKSRTDMGRCQESHDSKRLFFHADSRLPRIVRKPNRLKGPRSIDDEVILLVEISPVTSGQPLIF